MSATDIFLSYARTDRVAARLFAEAFVDEGFSVWWDASLHSGETFDEVIERKLRDAKAVVVLWSPRSVASRWVRAEATQADRKNKLAPAIIEACDRPIIFELTHAADLCDWHGDTSDVRWRTFMEDLRILVERHHDEQEANQAAARAQPAPDAPSRRPIRPGHDEVMFAHRKSPVTQSQPAPSPVAHVRDSDPAAEVHCLQIEGQEVAEELIVVDASGLRIGRSAPADIVIAHKSVSREHCIVGLANDELLVTDLNSTNGTFVDGERISRATVLPVASVLQLGEVSLRHSTLTAVEAQRRGLGFAANIDRGPQRLAATS